MLGSKSECLNCHGTKFRLIKINRTIQCEACNVILEERGVSDLEEYSALTQTEEVHYAVTPDQMHINLVDDIPNDPFCTPGFITAFRMLSPLREPVYAATARTLSGSLAEMERVIGDALFTGYVGYNGRAPGNAAKKEDIAEVGERHKSGGDARHTLVAYFEIVELASILSVDKETANLAILTFRHTASNTSLRNRNVESLATAAFVSAVERRWQEYQDWLLVRSNSSSQDEQLVSQESAKGIGAALNNLADRKWLTPPKELSIEEISNAANLDAAEVTRYLKVVNGALRKQRPENSASCATHMPEFCRRLELPTRTRNLAIGIAEKAIEQNICSRRNPASISAAAIYLACQLDGVRKTQTEICRATSLTEVTLRKVFKELSKEQEVLVPEWFSKDAAAESPGSEAEPRFARPVKRSAAQQSNGSIGVDRSEHLGASSKAKSTPLGDSAPSIHHLLPPPLPPGFMERQIEEGAESVNHVFSAPLQLPDPQAVPFPPPQPPALPMIPELPGSMSAPASDDSNPMAQITQMLNNPTMQAFAKALEMMPQFMPPPPPPLPDPPPLPPGFRVSTVADERKDASNELEFSETVENHARNEVEARNEVAEAADVNLSAPSENSRPSQGTGIPAPEASSDVMAGMQTMMGIMRAIQTFQSLQPHASSSQSASAAPERINPMAMMAFMMAQSQNENIAAGGSTDAFAGSAEATTVNSESDLARDNTHGVAEDASERNLGDRE